MVGVNIKKRYAYYLVVVVPFLSFHKYNKRSKNIKNTCIRIGNATFKIKYIKASREVYLMSVMDAGRDSA